MSWMDVRRRLIIAALARIDISALAIAYTGAMTDEIVTMGDGKQYRLLTLTSSGTLSIPAEVKADVWMCGGGSSHGMYANDLYSGGGGGYVASGYNIGLSDGMAAIVGAAEGTSSFAEISAAGSTNRDGGSGGGAHRSSQAGAGAGVTTYPFGDTTYFAGKPHSAGGAGGGYNRGSLSESDGGHGGSNGSNGTGSSGEGSGRGGQGGTYGGGNGGWDYESDRDGGNAFFYGGGGGGAGSYWDDDAWNPDDEDWTGDQVSGTHGAGYQGVIYVRIPLDQKAA